MAFIVIDNNTNQEISAATIAEIAEKGGLMVSDIDQFAVCEDGNLILLDDCGRFTYCDSSRFRIMTYEGEE